MKANNLDQIRKRYLSNKTIALAIISWMMPTEILVAAVGTAPHFPPGAAPTDVVGLRYSFRIHSLIPGDTALILFGHMRFYHPGEHKTHFIEANIYNGWTEYEDMGSAPWPPSRNGIGHGNQGGFSISVSDYNREGFVGVRHKNLSSFLKFPRMNSGIDGIPGLTKIEMNCQENLMGQDVHMRIIRGNAITFSTPQTNWGSRYRIKNDKQESSDILPRGRYQMWHIDASFGGKVYSMVTALPADEAKYFSPSQIIAFVTEFFEIQKTRICVHVWNPQYLEEGEANWKNLDKWENGYHAGAPDPYGPRITLFENRHILEFSNDKKPDEYLKKGEIGELPMNPTVQWQSPKTTPTEEALKISVPLVMSRTTKVNTQVKVRISRVGCRGQNGIEDEKIEEITIPAGNKKVDLEVILPALLERIPGSQISATIVSATPAAAAGNLEHSIYLGSNIQVPQWSPPPLAPLSLNEGISYLEKLGGKIIRSPEGNNQISFVDMGYREITDRAIFRISPVLSEARDLNFAGCRKISDQGLAPIGSFQKLEILNLADTSIHGDGLKHLLTSKNLKSLNLALCNELKNEGMLHVGKMIQLQSLNLASSGVGGEAIGSLASLVNLRDINLLNISITDNELEHLSMMPELESIHLGGTKVSENGIRRLKAKIPNLVIHR